jgi:protein SCO1/2
MPKNKKTSNSKSKVIVPIVIIALLFLGIGVGMGYLKKSVHRNESSGFQLTDQNNKTLPIKICSEKSIW